MKLFSENFTKYFWFTGGFAIGIMLISLGHAALPKKGSAPLSEMKAKPVANPEMDQDFARLNSMESHYAESIDQQNRLKTATSKVARLSYPVVKKKK